MINIMLVDDHPILLEGIKQTLDSEPDLNIMATATSGKEILEILNEKKPDVLVLDIQMPEMTGIEVARVIRQKELNVKILFLTQFENTWLMKQSIKEGAGGYVIKNVGKDKLVRAIKLVHKGEFKFFLKTAE